MQSQRIGDGSGRRRSAVFQSTALACAMAAAIAALSAFVPAAGAVEATAPVVRIDTGDLQGFRNDAGVLEYLNIPYAAPPVGPLRWMPPQPASQWKGTRDATSFGHLCAQTTTLGVFAGPASVDEDCLVLNVFTTGLHGKGRPVFVWIHGGGNVDGASNDYDGSKLATGGPKGTPTVVVTVNYRLGLLGYLAHPALDSEGHLSRNYGILDLQAALRWVQRNIAAFGGDPNTVLLGGQSAGASDTGANVLSPLATGLFNRALFQSSPTSTYPPLSVGQERGQAFADAAGCSGTGKAAADCLRKLSVQQVLALQGTSNANGPYVTGPMVDGTIIPDMPQNLWSTGRYNHMPMMGGNVRDEANFGIGITEYFSGPPQVPMNADQYTAAITRTYSGNAGPGNTPPPYPPGTVDAVLAEYPLSAYPSPQTAYDYVSTDPGACRALHVEKLWADRVPAYAYEFDYRQAPYYFPPMPEFTPLAAHTIDIQFLFPLWHGGILGVSHPLSEKETALSDELVARWTLFARDGNPNGGTGNAPWPRFVKPFPQMYAENLNSAPMMAGKFADRHHCEFWNQYLVYVPAQ
jgi:para-nitrobenzyl esterase